VSVEKIYWDADAFLGWLQEEPGKVELCKGTIQRAEAGEVLIVTSALTIAEVLWRKGGPRLPRDKMAMLRKFFRRSYIRVVNVTRAIAEQSQRGRLGQQHQAKRCGPCGNSSEYKMHGAGNVRQGATGGKWQGWKSAPDNPETD